MRFFLCLFLCLFGASNAYATAWTQEKGKGQAILTTSYYHTSSYFNNRGDRLPMNAYSKHEVNPYIEYGLYDGLTIGTSLSLQQVTQFGGPGAANQQSWNLGDSEFFVRKKLWEKDGLVFSAEPMVKLPSPNGAQMNPKIGSEHPDVGLTFSSGYSFKAFGYDHFIDAGAGMRHRFGAPRDQIKLTATAGFKVMPRLVIMPQVFGTLRAEKPETPLFTQSSGDDYNLTQFQLSAVYEWSDDISLQAGAFSHAAGRNVGNGDGLIFSVWKKF